MSSIPFIANLYRKAKENNVLSGIIIFDVIAFLSYVINPISFFYPGDIDLIFGGIVALLFALKNRKEHQNALKTGVYVAFFGAIVSAVSISVFFTLYVGFNFEAFWSLLITFLLMAIIIGLVLGLIIGYIYYRKDNKSSKSKSSSKYTDEYFEDLLKK